MLHLNSPRYKLYCYLLMLGGLFLSLPTQAMNSAALNHYKKGIKASKAKDCEKAKQHLQEALALEPKAKLVNHATRPIDYNPKKALRKLKRICPKKRMMDTATLPASSASVSSMPFVVHFSAPNQTLKKVPFATQALLVQGQVKGGKTPYKMLFNGKPIRIGRTGNFALDWALAAGVNTLSVTVQDAMGAKKMATWRVTRTQPKKALTFSLTEKKIFSKESHLKISGRVTGGRGVRVVTASGQRAKVQQNGSFLLTLANTKKRQKITVTVKDASGVIAKKTITIGLLQPLSITFQHKKPLTVDVAKTVEIAGVVKGGQSPLALLIAGKSVKIKAKGSFSLSIKVAKGVQTIAVIAKDKSGQRVKKVLPILAKIEAIAFAETTPPKESKTKLASVIVSGQVSGGRGKISLSINAQAVSLTQGRYHFSVPLVYGKNKISVLAKDQDGNQKEQQYKVYRELVLAIIAKGSKPNELVTTSVGRAGFALLGQFVARSGVPKSKNIRLLGYTQKGEVKEIATILHVSIQKSKLIFTLNKDINNSDLAIFKAVTLK